MTAAARSAFIRLAAVVLMAALAVPVRAQPSTPDLMAPSEVKTGMKGYGLTTLAGLRPQRFEFEVLGRLAGYFPKGDMVLIRMSGPVIDEAGIIAGMSGSPVYIDGKLLGAVAYGWSFCQIPLAGVTPAVDMMTVRDIEGAPGRAAKDRAREVQRQRARRLAELMTSVPGGIEMEEAVRQAAVQFMVPPAWAGPQRASAGRPLAPAGLLPAGVDPTIRPLPVPLSMGGGLPTDSVLLSMLEGSGFMPVQAAGAGASAADDVELEPGMTVGAALILGDMDIAGMGTLTWLDGEHALAFGHPMFGSGETDYPFVVGEVQAIVPSRMRSFKLASSGRVVGRIVQDREAAVLARLGEEPRMFPCTVRIRGAVDEDYSYRIAGHWETAPMLTFMALYYSSSRWEGSGGRCTLDARAEIRLKGRSEPLLFENSYTGYSPVLPLSDLVAMPMDALLLNPYEEVEIEGVHYEVEVTPGLESAMIESAWADRAKVEPGGRLTVHVRLKQERGEDLTRKLTLEVPDSVQPGSEVRILICDAVTNRMIERGLDPGFYAPTSFEGLLEALTRPESNRELVMRASVMDQGLRYAGAAMPALPPSALSILAQNEDGGRAERLVTDIVQRVETPWVLEGALTLSVTIKERGPAACGADAQPASTRGGE